MSKYIVTTDSGCDLPMEYCLEREIYSISMTYSLNGKSLNDTMDPNDMRAFYDGMRAGDAPKTSQVTPYQYTEFWKPLLKQGLPIIHIALGSGISGTCANGITAAEMLKAEYPEADIRVVDSTLASVGYGIMAIMAADMRDEEKSADECEARLNEIKGHINTCYTTGDLTYLYRSGRVSKTGMVIAHALNIWPILKLDLEGHLIVESKERGKRNTINRIYDIISERCENPGEQTLFICHSDIPDEAHSFGEEIKEKFGFKDVFYTYIGTTIGTNCGPGLMAAFFIGKTRQ